LNQSTALTALFATFLSIYLPVYADTKSTDACLADIQMQKPSEFVKLEKLNKNGKHTLSIEVRDNAGFEWEFTCDTKGKIINRQSEVSGVLMDAFKKTMKISEQSALTIALNVHPGKLKEVEYMICTNGSANYEFDISDTKLIDYKIEISAANGKIMEDSIQEWQIGEESEELK
jgi:uncharacterized membrane protein YkoI